MFVSLRDKEIDSKLRIKNVQILFLFNSKVTELSNSKWKAIYMNTNKSRRNAKIRVLSEEFDSIFDEQARNATILSLIGGNVVSDSRGRGSKARGTKQCALTKHTLSTMKFHRLTSETARHDRIPSLSTLLCFQPATPRRVLASTLLHWQPYERIYFRDVEIFSSWGARISPVSRITFLTSLTRVYRKYW